MCFPLLVTVHTHTEKVCVPQDVCMRWRETWSRLAKLYHNWTSLLVCMSLKDFRGWWVGWCLVTKNQKCSNPQETERPEKDSSKKWLHPLKPLPDQRLCSCSSKYFQKDWSYLSKTKRKKILRSLSKQSKWASKNLHAIWSRRKCMCCPGQTGQIWFW